MIFVLTIIFSFSIAFSGCDLGKVLTNIKLVEGSVKTNYAYNEEPDLSNIKITLFYNNNTTQEINTGFTIEGFDTTKVGLQTVVISYQQLETTFKINVVETLTETYVKNNSVKSTYYINDIVDYDNLILVLVYDSERKVEIEYSADTFSITNFTTDTVGTRTATITYETYEATFSYSVSKVPFVEELVSISYNSGLKTTFSVGEEINISNAKITLQYNSENVNTQGRTEEVSSGITVAHQGTETEGKKQFVLTYNGLTTMVEYEVTKAPFTEQIISISYISGLSTEFYVDNVINVSGVQVRVQYNSEDENQGRTETVTVSDGVVVSHQGTTETGQKLYTIVYEDFIATVNYSVSPKPFEAELISISYKSGLTPTFNIGDAIDTSNIVINLQYSSENSNPGEIVETTLGITVYHQGTATSGTKTYTISYKGFTEFVEYVVNADSIVLASYEKPETLAFYDANILEKTDKESEYTNRSDGYYVGTNNPFIITPQVSYYNETRYRFENITSSYVNTITVQVIIDGVAQSALASSNIYVTVDPTGIFNFTTASENKEFKITLSPNANDLGNGYVSESEIFSLNIKVINGYNVYSENELSKFDNSNNEWILFKTTNNIGTENITALILHKDMILTDANLADGFFETVSSEKYIKVCSYGIYRRVTNFEGEFSFIGNYFTINASQLSKQYQNINPTQDNIVKGRLFGFQGSDTDGNISNKTYETDKESGANHIFKNVNVIGNAPKSTTPMEMYLGFAGLQFMRNHSNLSDLTVENVIIKTFNAGICFDLPNTTLIKDSKIYDCFNTALFYYNSSANNKIVNCDLKRAGGPLVMTEAIGYTTDISKVGVLDSTNLIQGPHQSYVSIFNTTMYNPTIGSEPWYQLMGVAPEISNITTQLESIANIGGKTIIKGEVANNKVINLTCVAMSYQLRTFEQVRSGIKIYDNETNNNLIGITDIGSAEMGIFKQTPFYANSAPMLETDLSAFTMDASYNVYEITDSSISQLTTPEAIYTAGLFHGNWLSLYTSPAEGKYYIGLMVEYLTK